MNFQKVTRASKAAIEKYTKQWKLENADFCFTTLYLWGKHGKILYAEEAGALFFHYDFPDMPEFFLPPVPLDMRTDYTQYIKIAENEMKKMGFKPCFRSVSEPFIDHFRAYGYTLTRSEYCWDYIYLTESLATLKGKKLHAKRNHINNFLNAYPNWTYEKIDESNLEECMTLYDEWVKGKDEHTLADYDERLTVELAIKHMRELKLTGGCIRIGGKLAAFSVGERLTDEMMIVHIEKADSNIPGIYPLINREFVIHECEGTQFVNREDDMGLEGLRKAKQSYHPCRMIEKYIAE